MTRILLILIASSSLPHIQKQINKWLNEQQICNNIYKMKLDVMSFITPPPFGHAENGCISFPFMILTCLTKGNQWTPGRSGDIFDRYSWWRGVTNNQQLEIRGSVKHLAMYKTVLTTIIQPQTSIVPRIKKNTLYGLCM